ncbi:MAG: hypothetical protein IK032_02660 [Bacteroidales bacterium]|nr:hypothetical protein [Bacteroidales bacterium]MBR5028496.1 hypothetical protein [Bacteroidales bacterium]
MVIALFSYSPSAKEILGILENAYACGRKKNFAKRKKKCIFAVGFQRRNHEALCYLAPEKVRHFNAKQVTCNGSRIPRGLFLFLFCMGFSHFLQALKWCTVPRFVFVVYFLCWRWREV